MEHRVHRNFGITKSIRVFNFGNYGEFGSFDNLKIWLT